MNIDEVSAELAEAVLEIAREEVDSKDIVKYAELILEIFHTIDMLRGAAALARCEFKVDQTRVYTNPLRILLEGVTKFSSSDGVQEIEQEMVELLYGE